MFRVALSRLFRLDFWRCFQRQLSRQPYRAEQGCGHSKFLLLCFVRGYTMSSAFIQAGLSTTVVIALIVLVIAVGLMAFLFARSSAQRREREGRVRERMLEMEREAQFSA